MPGKQVKTIVIDPGHGGLDPGCNGANEIWEKAVTLAVSMKLGKMIEDSMQDVQVIYTRKTDKFVELWERPNMANKIKADLFISINYNPSTYDSNTETIAFQIKNLLKPGGKALIINPGTWAKDFNRILQIDEFATREMMRYSMLQNESVLVYENI
jgi:N-acetylmuramoyl-L-alanine amidase